MLSRRAGLFAVAIGLIAVAGAAHAQSPLGIGSAEPSFSVGGPFAPLMQWINVHQQMFYRALTGALKAMREDGWALSSLIGLSFAYGVFHAAGPGHGKAVISSYMIANETQLKRGILISFVSALLQGAVAIGLVGAAWLVLRGTSITMTKATQAMEIASFAMVALFGAWLLVRKLWSLRIRREPVAVFAPAGETAAGRTSGMGTGLRFQGKPVLPITTMTARAISAPPAVNPMRPIRCCSRARTSACTRHGPPSSPWGSGPALARSSS